MVMCVCVCVCVCVFVYVHIREGRSLEGRLRARRDGDVHLSARVLNDGIMCMCAHRGQGQF